MGSTNRVILAGVAIVLVSAATAVVTTMSLRPEGGGETATANVARKIFPAGPAIHLMNLFAKSGEVETRYDVVLSEWGNTESDAPADSGGG